MQTIFFDVRIDAMSTPENKTVRGRGRPAKEDVPLTTVVFDVRSALGWTQEEMAQQLKCSLSAVRAMEREKRLPGRGALLENFLRLAREAKVKIDL